MTVLLYEGKTTNTQSLTTESSVEKITLGDGYEQRVNPSINPVRDTWQVTWAGLSSVEAQALRSWLDGYRTTPLAWTTPLGVQDNFFVEDVSIDRLTPSTPMFEARAKLVQSHSSVVEGSSGGETEPGGLTGQIQYNNESTFGGDSGFTTNGSGSVNITGDLDVDNININGNTISSTTGNIILEPDGINLVLAMSGYDMSLGPAHSFVTKGYVDSFSVSPGGSTSQIQYNNNGSFAGDTGFTTDGVGNLTIDGSLTLSDVIVTDKLYLSLAGTGEIQVNKTYDSTDSILAVQTTSDTSTRSGGLVLGRARTDLQPPRSGNRIGTIYSRSISNTSTVRSSARIIFSATEDHDHTNNYTGTKIDFYTIPNLSSTNTLALTIDQDQSVSVGNIKLKTNTISSTNTDGNIVLDPNGSGTVDVSSARITSLATPTSGTDAVNKSYVDATFLTSSSILDSLGDVSVGSPGLSEDGYVLTWDHTAGYFVLTAPVTAGEVNTASNLGAGEGIYESKSGVDLRFKSLVAGTNVSLDTTANTITINAAAGSSETTEIDLGDILVAHAYNNSNGSSIAASSTGYVNFDTKHYEISTSYVSMSSGELTINDTGKFLIIAEVGVQFTTSSTKGSVYATIQTNNSGSFADIASSFRILSEAGASTSTVLQNANAVCSGVVEFATTGKKVRIALANQASVSAIVNIAKTNNIRIYKIENTAEVPVGGGGGGGSAVGAAGQVQYSDGSSGFTSSENVTYLSSIGGLRLPFAVTHVGSASNPSWTSYDASYTLPITVAHSYVSLNNQPASDETNQAVLTIDTPGSAPTMPEGTEAVFELTIENTHADRQITVVCGAGFTVYDGAIARVMRLLPGTRDTFKFRYRYLSSTGTWFCEGVPSIKDTFSFYFSTPDASDIQSGDVIGYFPPPGSSGNTMSVPGWSGDFGSCWVVPTPTTTQTLYIEERTGSPDTWSQRGTITIAADQSWGTYSFSAPQTDSTKPWRIRAPANLDIHTIHGFLNVMKKVAV
ncbi:hypothetical protein DF3PA_70132 [Candidatus Defluviicoccus seviourii]|uniref:Uncharacterized protein n=1 Tax=Candidatus Defluviicoccus seviourii TaxID=2565273 RepID=A0A564WHM5_9PROT|nr:hypothetical protein DF3PA_70132 [Candidatus Defluviicoccus seviourii]